jgi:hypothetical protein
VSGQPSPYPFHPDINTASAPQLLHRNREARLIMPTSRGSPRSTGNDVFGEAVVDRHIQRTKRSERYTWGYAAGRKRNC